MMDVDVGSRSNEMLIHGGLALATTDLINYNHERILSTSGLYDQESAYYKVRH